METMKKRDLVNLLNRAAAVIEQPTSESAEDRTRLIEDLCIAASQAESAPVSLGFEAWCKQKGLTPSKCDETNLWIREAFAGATAFYTTPPAQPIPAGLKVAADLIDSIKCDPIHSEFKKFCSDAIRAKQPVPDAVSAPELTQQQVADRIAGTSTMSLKEHRTLLNGDAVPFTLPQITYMANLFAAAMAAQGDQTKE